MKQNNSEPAVMPNLFQKSMLYLFFYGLLSIDPIHAATKCIDECLLGGICTYEEKSFFKTTKHSKYFHKIDDLVPCVFSNVNTEGMACCKDSDWCP